uniref:Uncharacterized protein n=1 Tax=Pyramimonas obovata TaxID=1411642 RepID=A0A7S0MSE8_9CHLO|mmetsp:Transcript_1241/g.2480  ORF Transcript_1241/g.2480 Transcript_1241/m.2480 type:complete len:259 (+) Transcript_1241:137-913(+)
MLHSLEASSAIAGLSQQTRARSTSASVSRHVPTTRRIQRCSTRQSHPLLGESRRGRSSFTQHRRSSARGMRHACRPKAIHSASENSFEFDENEDLRQSSLTLPSYFHQLSPIRGDEMEIWNVGGSDCDEAEGEVWDEPAWWECLEQVYVISFDDSGFYANRAENDDGEPVDIIVVFEDFEDALRHCGLLQANIDFSSLPEAFIEAIEPEALVSICEDKQCHVSVQRAGSMLMPPEQIVVEEDVESARGRLEQLFWDTS